MAKGKVWRDGRVAMRQQGPNKRRDQKTPARQFRANKTRLVEEDLDEELKEFMGVKGFRQGY